MYSPIIERHVAAPRNLGKPARFNSQGTAGDPGAGPFMVIYLNVRDERIEAAGFETYGCAAAIGCGSFLTELLKGRSLEAASMIDAATLRTLVGGLPLGKEHCADLAANALANALRKAEAPKS